MKPGLAVLPMDNWADVFVYPWTTLTRQQLAQIVHRFKERAFVEKLQTFLHDPKCGKHSLRYLCISQKWKITQSQYQASLTVAPSRAYGMWLVYEDREFPESEMPENITTFKQFAIEYIDDEVLAFLDKIKPLFTDVSLSIFVNSSNSKLAKNARIFFGHLLPMLASIRGICCYNESIAFLEQYSLRLWQWRGNLICSMTPSRLPFRHT